MTMRTADAIMARLAREVDTVFYLPGGGSGALVDALGLSGMRAVCCLHEQGAGYAAVGYAMIRGFGVCMTTSGPGATNAVTPCLAAWMDSVPVLFISGQVMRKWLALPGMRSRGVQEGPTVDIVRAITKSADMPMSGADALAILEDAITLAKAGRAGPVWLDVPMDVQQEEI
jgi:acetolactate synthase-1/2/3 large subunit